MNRADILLTINSNLEGIRKANESFLDLQRTARSMTGDVDKLGKSVAGFTTNFKTAFAGGVGLGAGFTAGAAAATVLLGAVREITTGIKQTVAEGVRFNATMETATFGIAGVLKQFDSKRFSDFSSAMQGSAQVIDALKQKSVALGLSFPELAEQYRATAGAMFKGGITDLNKQIELTVMLKRSMDAVGISGFQAVRDTADILNGIANRTMAGRMLHIEDTDLKAASEAGKLYDFLREKLDGFNVAANASMTTVSALEARLANTKAQVAADETKELTGAYKELLQSLTEFVKSDAFRETVHFFAMMTASLAANVKAVADALSGVNRSPTSRMLSANAKDFSTFREKANSVTSESDISAARASGEYALKWMEQTRAMLRTRGNFDPEAEKSVNQMIAATKAELDLLTKEGQLRIANNQKSADAAKLEAMSAGLAKDAAKAREDGVKKYATESEQAQARIRAAAKEANPAWYIELLNRDKASLTSKLNGPESKPGFYLGNGDAGDPAKARDAQAAADGYRLEVLGKIAQIEKEIEQTRDETAKKAKTEQDQRERANVHLLSVQAQTGTLDQKLAALAAEKAALDKNDVDFKAKALEIDMKAAKLKDDEAARLNAERAKEATRQHQAEIERIRDNVYLTDRQKKAQLYIAFKREEADLEARIAAARALVKSQADGSATKAQAQAELDRLLERQAVGLPHDLTENKPLTMMEETRAAMASLVSSFRTVASSISDVMGSAISGISEGLQGLITGTKTVAQAAWTVVSSIGQSIIRSLSDMAAQWLVQHTFMAGISKLFGIQEVATHSATEAAKTGATIVGAGARTGVRAAETATDVTLTGVKVAAHVAGEGTKTGATLLGGIIRIGSVLKEAVADVFKAGVGALSAMASIPYVGPILAVAAMGAIIAAGMGIVKGIGKGFAVGGYTGSGQRDEPAGTVHRGEWVAPKWMVEDPAYANIIAMLESERRGKQGYSWGGFVKLLGRGMPRWLQDPISRNVADKWNPVTGTKLYGNPQSGPVTVMDSRSQAQAEFDGLAVSRASAGVGSMLTNRTATSGGTAMAVSDGAGSSVNLAFYNTRQDAEQWLQSQRGRRVLTDFLKQNQSDL